MDELEKIKNTLKNLPEDAPQEIIQSTYSELKEKGFYPSLFIEVKDLALLNKKDIQKRVDKILKLTDDEMKGFGFDNSLEYENIKLKESNMILYYYNLICRLRKNEVEAWDQINELYEDD